jgi:tetratricopeptide (TPR) repeat protein
VYHPVLDILKEYFHIIEEDGESEIKKKIKNGLEFLNADATMFLPFILELFSVKDSGIDKAFLSPDARKGHVLSALKQIALLSSEIRPLIIVYENLHWIDKSSEEHLKDLLNNISGARIFLLLTYRPDFVHTWGGRSYHNHLNLNRLSNRETLIMVSHLLGSKEFDEETNQLILEKTEGIPFFIEQLISSLRDQKIIIKEEDTYCLAKDIREVTIPSTIQDVIMARVDLLPEETKALLQISSVVGREFGHRLLQKITNFSEERLLSHLSHLKDSELIYERGIYPQSTYIFKHALTQEVAYNSLLFSKRREIHRQMGEIIAQTYEEKLEEMSEILAYHFLEGEDWLRAYEYNLKAGLKVFYHSAYEEAQRYFEDALTALKNLPKEESRIEQEIDLRFHMRSALVPLRRHKEWGEWVDGAQLLAREIGDDARLSNALNLLSSLYWMEGQNQKAIALGEKALALAEKTENFTYKISTMLHMGIFFFTIGDYHKQIKLHQKVSRKLTGADAFQRHGLASFPSAWSRSHLVLGMAQIGEFDNIEEISREALEIAELVENNFTLVITYSFIGTAYLLQGKIELALPLLDKAHNLCYLSKIPFMYPFVAGSYGYAYLLANKPSQALTILKEGTKLSSLDGTVWVVHPLTMLADAYRASGDMTSAKEIISRALMLADERDERGFEAWAIFVKAKIQSDSEQLEEALQLYQHSLKQASGLSMLPLVAHCHKGLGDCYFKLGDEDQAVTENKSAIRIYRSLGMTNDI